MESMFLSLFIVFIVFVSFAKRDIKSDDSWCKECFIFKRKKKNYLITFFSLKNDYLLID